MKTDLQLYNTEPHLGLQQALVTLKEHVNGAINAIADNDLPRLEQSLWQQQVICAALQNLLSPLRDTDLSDRAKEQVLDAATQLQSLNQTYGELIEQARRTADILTQLCLGFVGDGTPVISAGLLRSLEA